MQYGFLSKAISPSGLWEYRLLKKPSKKGKYPEGIVKREEYTGFNRYGTPIWGSIYYKAPLPLDLCIKYNLEPITEYYGLTDKIYQMGEGQYKQLYKVMGGDGVFVELLALSSNIRTKIWIDDFEDQWTWREVDK